MILKLVIQGLRRGKARFACAVLGIALATGALVFMTSLVATNDAQAPAAALRSCVPWSAWRVDGVRLGRGAFASKEAAGRGAAKVPRTEGARADLELRALVTTIDYRPGGHVLQGPPMMAFITEAPSENPYGAVKLVEGRWVDGSSAEAEVVCVKAAMRRFGRMAPPALGEYVKFVGCKGTMTAKLVGYLDGERLPTEFPYVFANKSAFGAFSGEQIGAVSFSRATRKGWLTATDEKVVAAFKSDEQKRMDYARPLLLVAALLTALSLLVNSLLLSIESNRGEIATLRVIGLTRLGTVRLVLAESALCGVVGWTLGVLVAIGALAFYIAAAPAAYPAGMALDGAKILMTATILPLVIVLAVLFALAPALRVRPMDSSAQLPRPRRRGMVIAFALGFAAFVAVEVWGASLMRGFVPSTEWPDAIVSLLPGGVSSFDVEKLRDIDGVKRISELVPRQLPFEDPSTSVARSPRGPRNALFLAAEFLPEFKFVEGDYRSASAALGSSDAVVISLMMSRARALHVGDRLEVYQPGRRGMKAVKLEFPIVGVVDLNWHMVTSRGLVRGLNGASPMTDGPVFCSLDTMGVIDPRTYITEPAMSAPMTHLWVEYDAGYLAAHGVFETGRLIEAEIARRLGNPVEATVRLHARDEIADGTLAHGTDLIGEAARVPFVFLAILAIGFVAMLVAEADSRRREFAVLRAVGATRGDLAARLVKTALRTALVGITVGLPLGAAAGWYTAIGTASVWPGMPHYFEVPWRVIGEGALGAIVFALVFAIPASLANVKKG